MLISSITLLVALGVILLAAELFTNTLEHLGQHLQISEGVTASLLAAVGTALPETVIPLIAIFSGSTRQSVGEEIGVGAILGAPLMLSTLTLSLMGLSAFGRPEGRRLQPEVGGLHRDLNFFLAAFVLATLAMFVPARLHLMRVAISAVLCLLYLVYVVRTLKASPDLVRAGHGTQADTPLTLGRIGLGQGRLGILVQGVLALLLLLGGARAFIAGVDHSATALGLSPLLLSLLLVPLATELPEKINSMRWIRRGKDTLAFGNVTGAMVFQGTLLPAVGLLLTPWSPRPEVVGGALLTLAGAAWLRMHATARGFAATLLLVNGALYALYLLGEFTR